MTKFDEIESNVTRRIAAAGESTKDIYEEAVKAVIAEYEAAKKITEAEAKEIGARLHASYAALKGKAS